MIFVGVDPGLSGAIVAVDESARCVYQCVMPCEVESVKRGSQRRRVDPVAVHAALIGLGVVDTLAIEQQTPTHNRDVSKRRQSAANAYVIGQGVGRLEAACRLAVDNVLTVHPRTWQRVLNGVPGSSAKERAAWVASRMPGLDLTPGRRTVLHDGLADAACIAMWVMKNGGVG